MKSVLLTPFGDSLALVLDRSTLNILGVDESTPLVVDARFGELTCRRAAPCDTLEKPENVGVSDAQFLANLEAVNRRHARTLKALSE